MGTKMKCSTLVKRKGVLLMYAHLLLMLLFTGTHAQTVVVEDPAAIYTLCVPDFCSGEGVCHVGNRGFAVCDCYTQYFSGRNCKDYTLTCGAVYVPQCHSGHTSKCWNYYGANMCRCKRGHYGRICEHSGRDFEWPSYLAVYVKHEVDVNDKQELFLCYEVAPRYRTKYTLDVEDTRHFITMEHFVRLPPGKSMLDKLLEENIISKHLSNAPYLTPQKEFHVLVYEFQHVGRRFISLLVWMNVTWEQDAPPSLWNWGQIGGYFGFRTEKENKFEFFSAYWSFEYNVIVNMTRCCPDYRFSEGAGSPFSYWTPHLLKRKLYRLTSALLPRCNGSSYSDPKIKYRMLQAGAFRPSQVLDETGGAELPSKSTLFYVDDFNAFWAERYQISMEISEIPPRSTTGSGSVFTASGKDSCWIMYHDRKAPVVTIEAGAQFSFFTNDNPILRASLAFIDNLSKRITGGFYRNYPILLGWTCTITNYGYASNVFDIGCNDGDMGVSAPQIKLGFMTSMHAIVEFRACLRVKITEDHCGVAPITIHASWWIFGYRIPVLILSCMKNCGEGHKNSYYKADRDETTLIRVQCIKNLAQMKGRSYRWFFNGNIINPRKRSFFEWQQTVPRNKQHTDQAYMFVMLRRHAFPHYISKVNIQVTAGPESPTEWAWFYMEFFAPPAASDNRPETLCPDVLKVKGISLHDDFEVCIPFMENTVPTTYMFYHAVAEFPSSRGVMLAKAQVPYMRRLLLPASAGQSHIVFVVGHDVTASEYEDSYHNLEIYPPPERRMGPMRHMELIEAVFHGRLVPGRPSVRLSARFGEVSEVAQKLHWVIVELSHMENPTHAMLVADLKYRREKMLLHGLESIKITPITLPLDAIQLSTIIKELIFVNPLPLKHELAKVCADVIFMLSTHIRDLTINDWYYNDKPYRLRTIAMPLLQSTTAIIFPTKAALRLIMEDEMTSLIRKQTESEIRILHNEEHLDDSNYENYVLVDTEIANKLEAFRSATSNAMYACRFLAQAIGFALEPSGRDLLMQWPAVILQPSRTSLSKMYMYVKLDYTTFFTRLNFQIGRPRRAYVNFTTDFVQILGLKPVSVQLVLTDHMPYWWHDTSQNILDNALYIQFEDAKHTRLAAPFVIHYEIDHIPQSFIRGIAHKLRREEEADSSLTQHYAIVRAGAPTRLVITFDKSLVQTIVVVPKEGKKPNLQDFHQEKISRVGRYAVDGNPNYVVEYQITNPRSDEVNFYIGVMPDGDAPVQYLLTVHAIQCNVWNESDTLPFQFWQKGCMNAVMSADGEYLQCTCSSLEGTLFSGTYEHIRNKLYGWMAISLDSQPQMSYICIGTLLCLLCIYAMLVFIAYTMDSNDEGKKHVMFLVDNRVDEEYSFIIVVVTGSHAHAATTAKVGIKLFGSQFNSKRHILQGVTDVRSFQRRAVDFFALTTSTPLGSIRAVEVWTDHRGVAPSWLCEKVIIRDYNKMIEWVFMVRKWFSLVYGDHKIHRVLYQTKQPELGLLETLFQSEDFFLHHIWFGMFVRQHCHSFSRKTKVSVAFSIVLLAQAMCLIFGGITAISPSAVLDEGDFHMDYSMYNALWALLVSVTINYPIMYIFKNSQPNPRYNFYFEDFSGIDPMAPLPIYFLSYKQKFTACVLLSVICLSSGVFIMWAGFGYGVRKSYMWFGSLICVLIYDAVILESIHVVCRAFVWRFLMMRKDTQRFCNEIVDLDVEEDRPLANVRNKKFLLKKDMFLPVPRELRKVLQVKEFKYLEYRALLSDLFIYVVFMAVLFYTLITNRDEFGYYSGLTIRNVVVDGLYTDTLGFHNVSSMSQFLWYMNQTLLHSIHWQAPCWLAMSNIRLLGVVQLRQLRTKLDHDPCVAPLEFAFTLEPCYSDLDESTMDTWDYIPMWGDSNASSMFPIRDVRPFHYQSPSTSKTFTRMGRHRMFPAGGYIATLGRSGINTRTTLNFLRNSHWFDEQTRIIFIDFITYNAHSNLFNVVTLTLEKSITGDYFTTDQIENLHFVHRDTSTLMFEYGIFAALVIMVGFLLIGQFQSVVTRGFLNTLSDFWNTLDLLTVILACVNICILYNKARYTTELMNLIEVTRQNHFTNFAHIIRLDYVTRICSSLILFLVTFRLWKVLRFNAKFRIVEYTMIYAVGPLLNITVILLASAIFFTVSFHLYFGPYYYNYHILQISIMMVFGIPFKMDPIDMSDQKPHYTHGGLVGYCFFGFFLLVFKILILNIFIAVIMSSYHKARLHCNRQRHDFPLSQFIKERILKIRDESESLRSQVIEAARELRKRKAGNLNIDI